ncbi:hydroxyacid dehydrogenase [Candidatus Poribacteria bacterium]
MSLDRDIKQKPKVLMLVTGSLFEQVFRPETLKELSSFAETITPAEKDIPWKEFLPIAEGIITSWGSLNEITEEVLDQAPELKIIGHAAGSARNCAKIAIPRDIIVVNAAPAIARSVAEYCLGMTIACLRSFLQHDKNIKESGTKEELSKGREHIATKGLFLKKVGLVGFGYTAREFAKLLKIFDAEVSVFDPYVDDEIIELHGVKRAVDLKELLSNSDIVSLHIPGHARHTIGREEFKCLKDGAVFVNSSGGAVYDPEAFTEEVKTGRFWAATETDPFGGILPPDSPLRSLTNVILTPHIAGPTIDARWMMGDCVVEELRRFFAGENPLYAITEGRVDHVA